MFTPVHAFSGFSVTDLDAARAFYRDVLGLAVEDNAMGTLMITLPGGCQVLAYPKPNHEPASFTVLNLVATNVEAAVDELNALGVKTKIYDDAVLPTDAKGIQRAYGQEIAWFTDPAGNVISVLSAPSSETP